VLPRQTQVAYLRRNAAFSPFKPVLIPLFALYVVVPDAEINRRSFSMLSLDTYMSYEK
jgi:hypothetical protein